MSRIVLVCHRNGRTREHFPWEAERLSHLLFPDNISFFPPEIRVKDGVHLAVINPVESLPLVNASVALGCLFPLPENWHRPGGKRRKGLPR